MQEENYRTFWERAAATPAGARAAVDGSADEATLRQTGLWTAKQVAAALLLHEEDAVLELGCGVARIGRELAPRCRRWCGVDIAANMLAVARSRTAHLNNVEFYQLSRTSLEMFAPHTFDKAYAVAVFIHLDKEDVFLYLCELQRVLRPGGILYFDTWNLAHEVGWQRWLMEVEQWARSSQHQRKDVARNQFCVPAEVQLYVRRAGFLELFCLTDSPWIQMIAAKPGEGGDIEALREQIRPRLPEIAFSPLWTQLFRSLLEVLSNRKQARAFWQELTTLGAAWEAEPYRHYFLALWKTRQHEWGTLPSPVPEPTPLPG
jgi:SAM-dependent methyltransferase